MIVDEKMGTAAFSERDGKEDQGGFNLSEGGDVPSVAPAMARFEPQAVSNKTIANNSGGGIPGGGGGGEAKLDGRGGRSGASPGSPGYSTDIDQGSRSGGYSNPVGGQGKDGDSGDSDPSFGSGRGPSSVKGLDLSKYLPGGSADPNRRLGGINSLNKEIYGPHVNIWERVSTRLQTKCRLRELLGCEAGR